MAKPVGTGTFSNLGHTQAFEAVNVIRRRCANFHLGPGQKMTPHHEAEYMTATVSRSSDSRNSLARGSGPYMCVHPEEEDNACQPAKRSTRGKASPKKSQYSIRSRSKN